MGELLRRHWFIIAVTLAAAFLRFYNLSDSLQFLGDQGRDALVMYRIFSQRDLPFIGPITSVGGFYLGPLYYWFMAPFLWAAGFDPVGPALATALIGVITVPLLYFVTRKLFDPLSARWASLLYALAFIPVSETRSAWNPNPMPLAALGLLYGLYQAQKTKNGRWLYLAGLSLGLGLQLHYMIVFLAPFLLWQGANLLKNKKRRPFFLKSLGLMAILMLPLILFEIKNNFLNYRGLIEFFTKNQYSQVNLIQKIKDLNGRSEQAVGMVLGFGRDFSLVRAWVTRLFLLAAAWAWYRGRSLSLKLLFGWLVLSIAALVFYHANIYPHYLGFLFPVVFILLGFLLARLKGKLFPFALALAWLFFWYNLPQVKEVLAYQGNLKNVKQTSGFILEDIKANGHTQVNVALLDDTRDYRASNYRYFLEVTGVNLLDFDQYPEAQVLYVVSTYEQKDLLTNPTWEIQSLKPAEVIAAERLTTGDFVYKIQRL